MKTVYRCEKCGMVFDDYDIACDHENRHFSPKTWIDSDDSKVVFDNTEWIPELYAPSAVVVPLERSFYDENGKWTTETSYVKYYYSAKKAAEQVFPIDETIMKN